MLFAQIRDDRVVAVMVARPPFLPTGSDWRRIDDADPTPGIGWTYRAGTFLPPASHLPGRDRGAQWTAQS